MCVLFSCEGWQSLCLIHRGVSKVSPKSQAGRLKLGWLAESERRAALLPLFSSLGFFLCPSYSAECAFFFFSSIDLSFGV